MNRDEFLGKLNALYVGDKNCLEELITTYDEKDKEIERLNNVINKIDEYVNNFRYYADEDDDGYKISKDIHNILQELKGSDSNAS